MTGMTVKVDAHAKINLVLDVLSKRGDGLHELRMIMQTLKLHDTLTIQPAESGRIALELGAGSTVKDLPMDESNLVYRAAELMLRRYGIDGGVRVCLEKRIPVAAGLAGGSADCAAALIGLNSLFGLGLSEADLLKLGLELGADVPFCVLGGTCLAEGAGERLTRLGGPHPPAHVVLVRPVIPVSTASVFADYDAGARSDPDAAGGLKDLNKIIAGIAGGDLDAICAGTSNALEGVTARRHPVISEIKSLLLSGGAKCAQMSGSGPTVFAYFDDIGAARRAMDSAERKYQGSAEVFLTGIEQARGQRLEAR